MADTVLELTGIGVPPWSARGLRETLEPLAGGGLRRTVNGTLIDLSDPQHRKYRVTIAGRDLSPPALDAIWQGMPATVDCVTELAYPTGSSGAGRAVVPGSERIVGDFTVYRPRLSCLVDHWTIDRDEWQAIISWTLELEEV